MRKFKFYLINILVSIDQLLNTLLGGDPDETISSRCGKRRTKCKVCGWLCWALDKIDPRHCAKYIERDEGARNIF
jgi:hypothetical protein